MSTCYLQRSAIFCLGKRRQSFVGRPRNKFGHSENSDRASLTARDLNHFITRRWIKSCALIAPLVPPSSVLIICNHFNVKTFFVSCRSLTGPRCMLVVDDDQFGRGSMMHSSHCAGTLSTCYMASSADTWGVGSGRSRLVVHPRKGPERANSSERAEGPRNHEFHMRTSRLAPPKHKVGRVYFLGGEDATRSGHCPDLCLRGTGRAGGGVAA